MFPPRETCADISLGLWISANSVGYIDTAKSLHNSRKQFDSKGKSFTTLNPGTYLDYTPILHIYFALSSALVQK